MTTPKCIECRLEWPFCGAATNVYWGSIMASIPGTSIPVVENGCASHYQPRQSNYKAIMDAAEEKSCNNCKDGDHAGCSYSWDTHDDCPNWTPRPVDQPRRIDIEEGFAKCEICKFVATEDECPYVGDCVNYSHFQPRPAEKTWCEKIIGNTSPSECEKLLETDERVAAAKYALDRYDYSVIYQTVAVVPSTDVGMELLRDLLAVIHEQRQQYSHDVGCSNALFKGIEEVREIMGARENETMFAVTERVVAERDSAIARVKDLEAQAKRGKVSIKGYAPRGDLMRVQMEHYSTFTIMEYKGQGWDVPVTLTVEEGQDE